MKLLVTGATGFVGRAVVDRALAQGHDVVAALRPATDLGRLGPAAEHPHLNPVRIDLRSRAGLDAAVAGVECVIHLAAAKAGDFQTQFSGTVVATENLLDAMARAGTPNLVGVSSFSVYDFGSLKAGSMVTETTPIDADPRKRDEYAQTKLLQEDLYHDFAAAGQNRTVVLRPGMIFGPGELWHALLGAQLGPRFLRIGSRAVLPLTYVENCAEAMLLAAEGVSADRGSLAGEIVNIVDDGLPTQAEYVEMVSNVITPPTSMTVPWPLVRFGAEILDRANDLLFDGRAKFPGIAVPARLDSRFKPLRYDNAKAKRLLGWQPRYGMAEAIARSAEVAVPLDRR